MDGDDKGSADGSAPYISCPVLSPNNLSVGGLMIHNRKIGDFVTNWTWISHPKPRVVSCSNDLWNVGKSPKMNYSNK